MKSTRMIISVTTIAALAAVPAAALAAPNPNPTSLAHTGHVCGTTSAASPTLDLSATCPRPQPRTSSRRARGPAS